MTGRAGGGNELIKKEGKGKGRKRKRRRNKQVGKEGGKEVKRERMWKEDKEEVMRKGRKEGHR